MEGLVIEMIITKLEQTLKDDFLNLTDTYFYQTKQSKKYIYLKDYKHYFTGLGKITSLLSATFRPIFIAINWENSGNSLVTLYVQRDLN
jgi:hypothetical protein